MQWARSMAMWHMWVQEYGKVRVLMCPVLTTHHHCWLWGLVSPQGRGQPCQSERRIEHSINMSCLHHMCCHHCCQLWDLVCPQGRGQPCLSGKEDRAQHQHVLSLPHIITIIAIGYRAWCGHVCQQGRWSTVTWLQKRKLEKQNERENEKKYQKTCPTRAWGRGIDRVVKTYPDPYLGQVYPAGSRVSHTRANP